MTLVGKNKQKRFRKRMALNLDRGFSVSFDQV